SLPFTNGLSGFPSGLPFSYGSMAMTPGLWPIGQGADQSPGTTPTNGFPGFPGFADLHGMQNFLALYSSLLQAQAQQSQQPQPMCTTQPPVMSMPPPPAPASFDQEYLKQRHDDVIDALYSGKPCAQCG